MKGSQESLTTAVVKDAANWPTPQAQDTQRTPEAYAAAKEKRGGKMFLSLNIAAQLHGQAAPANWPTPEATSSCHGHGGTWSTTQFNLHNAAMGIGILPPQWPIRRPDNKTQTTKERMAKRAAKHGQAAPASSSSHGSRQGLWQTPKATNADCPVIHNPQRSDGGQPNLAAQMMLEQTRQEQWAAPQAHDAQGPKTPEHIAVMRAKGHGVKNLNEQAQWGTPTARDHKSGRGNEEREYKELTPMVERQQSGKLNPRWVETLMGLPIGWTMPSCTSPQTIAPTNSDCSAMALFRPAQSELSDCLLAS
jgi:hypothetical protein